MQSNIDASVTTMMQHNRALSLLNALMGNKSSCFPFNNIIGITCSMHIRSVRAVLAMPCINIECKPETDSAVDELHIPHTHTPAPHLYGRVSTWNGKRLCCAEYYLPLTRFNAAITKNVKECAGA